MLVFTSDAEILLLKRTDPFEFWQSVTGSLLNDEDHASAARRELFEETGMTREGEMSFTGVSRQFKIDQRWRDRFPPGIVENVEYEYHFRLPEKTNVNLSDNEHSGLEWVTLDVAIDRVWSWTNRSALESLKVVYE